MKPVTNCIPSLEDGRLFPLFREEAVPWSFCIAFATWAAAVIYARLSLDEEYFRYSADGYYNVIPQLGDGTIVAQDGAEFLPSDPGLPDLQSSQPDSSPSLIRDDRLPLSDQHAAGDGHQFVGTGTQLLPVSCLEPIRHFMGSGNQLLSGSFRKSGSLPIARNQAEGSRSINIDFSSVLKLWEIESAGPNSLMEPIILSKCIQALKKQLEKHIDDTRVATRLIKNGIRMVDPKSPVAVFTSIKSGRVTRITKKDGNRILAKRVVCDRVLNIFKEFWEHLRIDADLRKISGKNYIQEQNGAFDWLWRTLVEHKEESLPTLGLVRPGTVKEDYKLGANQHLLASCISKKTGFDVDAAALFQSYTWSQVPSSVTLAGLVPSPPSKPLNQF